MMARRRLSTFRARALLVGATLLRLAVVGVLVATAVACSPRSSLGPSTVGAEARYLGAGPHPVGHTRLATGYGDIDVWYPAELTTEAVAETLDARDALPPRALASLPPDVDLTWTTPAAAEAPAAEGRFPLVLLTHGFFEWPQAFARLAIHVAGWGMIVAAPEFRGFSIDAIERGVDLTNSTSVLVAARQALDAVDRGAGGPSPLAGHLAPSAPALIGHSFGAVANVVYATSHPVSVAINLAAASVPPNLGRFDTPSLWLAAADDFTRANRRVASSSELTVGVSGWGVVPSGGHVGLFTDLCVMGPDGMPVPPSAWLVRDYLDTLFHDGCDVADLELDRAVVNHFTVAMLRWQTDLDHTPVGLSSAVLDDLPVDGVAFEMRTPST